MGETKSNLDRAIAYLQCYRFGGCIDVGRFNEAISCLENHVKEKKAAKKNEVKM